MTPQAPSLLPCPFCGDEVEIIKSHVAGEADWIQHKRKGFEECGMDGFSDFLLSGDLATAWNTRTQPDAGMRWQPIETAPKTGERYLVLENGNAFQACYVGGYESGDVWFSSCSSGKNIYNPTHWMPLPAAPNAQPPATGDDYKVGRYTCGSCLKQDRMAGSNYCSVCEPCKKEAAGEQRTCPFGDDCDLTIAYMKGVSDGKRDKTDGLERVREALEKALSRVNKKGSTDFAIYDDMRRDVHYALATLDSIMGVKNDAI